jgi:hypothetical protein
MGLAAVTNDSDVSETIYVRLPDEAVDVWRPILASRKKENVFVIDDQPYGRGEERWEFEPGDLVAVEARVGDTGPFLAAVRRIP